MTSYGAPTHRLEEYMSMSSRALEIEARFLYIPDCVTIGLDPGPSMAHPAEVELVRVSEGINLGRQQDVHDILMDVTHDRLGVEEARRLDEVLDKRPKFEVLPVYHIKPPCYFFDTKPVMSNIHVNVMNVLQFIEIIPCDTQTSFTSAVRVVLWSKLIVMQPRM
ncbi:hypothetical protein E4U33_003309 [Claviceps sp. LM78 group G4]|nr:hypothetical protein E4U33_003309 [Claviceps sp. LM78 group G4]